MRKFIVFLMCFGITVGLSSNVNTVNAASIPSPFPKLSTGVLYHGVHPSGGDGDETFKSFAYLTDYEKAVGKTAAWVYFSQEWSQSSVSPTVKATSIRNHGSLPVIRLMFRSAAALNGREGADPAWSLNNIISGKFDKNIDTWAAGAKTYGLPVLAEFGTEANGDWFGWNGRWNGAGSLTYGDVKQYDGPERFRVAYRHIVDRVRAAGANNVGFVFHVDAEDSPVTNWNKMELYYPGASYVDVVGVSAYGSQSPIDGYTPTPFRTLMDTSYARMSKIAPGKPLALLEFGSTRGGRILPEMYAKSALTDITARRWPNLIEFSWWNEGWQNDNNPAHDSEMRVQMLPKVATVFRDSLGKTNTLNVWKN